MHQRDKAPGSRTCRRMKQTELEWTKQVGRRMKQNASAQPGLDARAILPNVS